MNKIFNIIVRTFLFFVIIIIFKYLVMGEYASWRSLTKPVPSNVTFNYFLGWNVACFSLKYQILITLMKLKLNLGHKYLAFRFNTSSSTVTNVTMTFIILLRDILFKSLMDNVPSQLKNQLCLPNYF
jgi:hypothetical protein